MRHAKSSASEARCSSIGLLVCLGLFLGCTPSAVDDPGDRILGTSLSGVSVDLLDAVERALVLIFIAPDCPISNRYVPEINRLYDDYASRGVDFFVVYTDGTLSSPDFADHLREYALQVPALVDLSQDLRSWAGVRVTPEVALFDPVGRLQYRGRINNRFVTFGTFRPRATRHDLRLALDAVLAGGPVAEPLAEAIGCFIPPPTVT